MTLEDFDLDVATALTDDEEEQQAIVSAFLVSRNPFGADAEPIPLIQESYARLCYWYAVSKRRKRGAEGDKRDWQFYEDYMEGGVKALNSALISSMHLNKHEKGIY